MTKHKNCKDCKALDARLWRCKLGYQVLSLKAFTPATECPKPLTDEEFSSAENKRGK